MRGDESIPRIREDLEVIPTSYQGQKALLVRDFLGLVREPVILQGEVLNVVGLIDGKRTVRDIQVELVRLKSGVLVDAASIGRLVRALDEANLLQSDRYRSEKEKALRSYLRQTVRTSSHGGSSYPGTEAELRALLDDILGGGEGRKDGRPGSNPFCLVAPHIDLGAGKKVYGQAYRSIRHLRPRRVLLFGTGHSLSDSYFSLTEKDYETPLGRATTDREAVRLLRKAGGKTVSAYDIHHRSEHSLEFQVVFLQHLFDASVSIVPILCGSFSGDLARVRRPAEIEGVGGFLEALGTVGREDPDGTLVVAGVDFSHIGPKFGHRENASALLLEARAHDQALIDALTSGDAAAFWEEARKVGDRYNVCGFSTLAVLLDAFPGMRGRLLGYEFWREEATRSAVSFAAVVLENRQ